MICLLSTYSLIYLLLITYILLINLFTYLRIYLFTYILIYLFTHSVKLIFWPKMTKCQTILHRKNFFHHFFDLFSTQNRSIQKNKKIKKNFFFQKFDQNSPFFTLFGSKIGPDLVKMTWKYFFRFFRALNMKNDGSYDKIRLILIFCHFRSKKGFLG